MCSSWPSSASRSSAGPPGTGPRRRSTACRESSRSRLSSVSPSTRYRPGVRDHLRVAAAGVQQDRVVQSAEHASDLDVRDAVVHRHERLAPRHRQHPRDGRARPQARAEPGTLGERDGVRSRTAEPSPRRAPCAPGRGAVRRGGSLPPSDGCRRARADACRRRARLRGRARRRCRPTPCGRSTRSRGGASPSDRSGLYGRRRPGHSSVDSMRNATRAPFRASWTRSASSRVSRTDTDRPQS